LESFFFADDDLVFLERSWLAAPFFQRVFRPINFDGDDKRALA